MKQLSSHNTRWFVSAAPAVEDSLPLILGAAFDYLQHGHLDSQNPMVAPAERGIFDVSTSLQKKNVQPEIEELPSIFAHRNGYIGMWHC